ncbi:glycosyltransferase [Larkinella soli]|uniref:glycosyltransferase n=1 Tax=Larkinella soli TaxID=1770527 RepID=UPI000FFC8550|nr:glycosyltransferase [Larkinella soli]
MSNIPTAKGTRPGSGELLNLLGKSHTAFDSEPDIAIPGKAIQDLICFSHLRWNFVYQRPQHLLSRASRHWRVWFWEEPVHDQAEYLEVRPAGPRLTVLVPHLPADTSEEKAETLQRRWLHELTAGEGITDFIAWYYTPMAMSFTSDLTPRLTLYDCMDELSAFRGASPGLRSRERQLMEQADLVFTGGYSLYEARQHQHSDIHPFPSGIDVPHFGRARAGLPDPPDQQALAGPRIGFCGVIDERVNLGLLEQIARHRPDWQFILLGPVVKIDPATLPQAPNLHYLGMKSYEELPAYFSNWQAAILPFALNEATRFISPTKTPEYLAAGLPVVSTPIRDVVHTYGGQGPVWIADTARTYIQSIQEALQFGPSLDWADVDDQLKEKCWHRIWNSMHALMDHQLRTISSGNPSGLTITQA